MAVSFLAFATLTFLGAHAVGFLHRRLVLTSNVGIDIGVGFFVAMGLVALLVEAALFPVSTGARLALWLGIVGSALIAIRKYALGREVWQSNSLRLIPSGLALLILALLLVHLLLILVNNLYREVFPWDAFTTWMYRAKALAVSDSFNNFAPLSTWIQGDTSDYAVFAAQYPMGVSSVAAFAASLSDGWSDALASLPWLYATLASIALMMGLCKLQVPHSKLAPLIGGALLATAPIVHLHGMLAGYADIWVMGTSGMGLAGLCIWSQQRSQHLLVLSLVLLVLGCFWKTEGWLWLGLGVACISLFSLWQTYQVKAVIVTLALLVTLWLLQPFDLGPLGRWGVDAEGIELGALVTTAFRPYNPLENYLEMTFWQASFLLLVPMYVGALILLLIRRPKGSSGYLLVGLGVLATHGVIFGLSEYSKYAQIGTAINRLLLQTLPVFVITLTALARRELLATALQQESPETGAQRALLYGGVATGLASVVALPLAIIALAPTAPGTPDQATGSSYAASDLRPVIGTLIESAHGQQFTGADLPIGVAAAPMDQAGTRQPRYLVTQSWMVDPETISFYWINSESPQVHSIPIQIAGQSVIDMSDYPDFWNKPIKELGFLVRPEYFSSTALGGLTLTDSLLDAVPALINHWITPAPLSHRLINASRGHLKAPVTAQAWLTFTFFIVCLGCLAWALLSPERALQARACLLGSTCILWLVGSFAHLNQAYALTAPLKMNEETAVNEPRADGSHLKALSARILASHQAIDEPILTLGLDEQGRFNAQRLPFMLLPLKAASINRTQLKRLAPDTLGSVIIFGYDQQRANAVAESLYRKGGFQTVDQGEGYVMLSSRTK